MGTIGPAVKTRDHSAMRETGDKSTTDQHSSSSVTKTKQGQLWLLEDN